MAIDLGPVQIIKLETISDEGRAAWLAERMRDVTASDVASICGIGRRSPYAVWAEKQGLTEGVTETNIMERGRVLEPSIMRGMAIHYPKVKLYEANVYLRALQHRLGATPDFFGEVLETFVGEDGHVWHPGPILVQGKIVSRPVFDEKWLEDPGEEYSETAVPLEFQLQTLTETMLFERAFNQVDMQASVAALTIDTYSYGFHFLPVNRHEKAEALIIKKADEFWAGGEPPVDYKRDYETLARIWPADSGEEIDLTDNNALPALFDERKDLGEVVKAAELRRAEIKTEFLEAMREASIALLADGRRVSLKKSRDSLVPAHIKKGSRVLRIAKAD